MATNEPREKQRLAQGLQGLLADTYVLYHSTQTCHWNVEGPLFHALHRMFEEQYTELAEAVDVIAERVRGLGYFTSMTLFQLAQHSRIRQPEELRGSEAMLEHLIEAHMQVVHRAHELRGEAEEVLDEATADLLVERLRVHEKTLWLLRSQAGTGSAQLTKEEPLARAG